MAEREKREKVRRHIVEEFVLTERTYIDKLSFLKKVRQLLRLLLSLQY